MNAKNVRDEFKKKGIKTSFQRLKIYNFLCKDFLHPTVDDIYRELVKEIPTLSKTTVYNNLAMFIEKNLAREVKIDKNEARYELNRGPHGHFKCNVCGRIEDFDADFLSRDVESLKGYEISTKDLYYSGICERCLNARSKKLS